MPIIPPTTTANIGFGFGSTNFASYEDRTWHGDFYVNFHGGIDYWGPLDYPIWSCANGVVLYAGFAVPYIGSAGGNGVVIQHGPSMKSIYGHMNTVSVSPGQQVMAGQRIGTMGQSGIANGVIHLHFEVRTITAMWGEDVENPNELFPGGSLASDPLFGNATDDVPSLEPLSGALVKMGLFIPTPDGYWAPSSRATSIIAVYFDRLKAAPSQYTIVERSGSLMIDPVAALSYETEVRGDYYV